MAEEWGGQPFENGQMAVVGNVLRAGPSTPRELAFMMIGGHGDVEYFGRDNIAVDRIGNPLPMFGRYATGRARIIQTRRAPTWPERLEAMAAVDVERYVLRNAGARPWDRDRHDIRVIADTAEGRGQIINSEDEVGGYPVQEMTRRAFDAEDWNLADMSPAREGALDSGARARGT
jgi:hypothetical protein